MFPGDILRQRYKIIKQLGSGHFGNTYLAIDLDFPVERLCVVKHLSPKNPAPEAFAIAERLFRKEAESLSSLGEHDRIPRLYAYFEENGQFYLVQEYIQGHNLTEEFQPGKRWSEAETVQLLQELLEILAFVHREKKIHQDVKPANIMRRDGDGKLILIDFGAVKKAVNVDEKGETSIIIGTPAYMAPEHSLGRSEFCSDVYAVGILGIQALTDLPAKEVPRDKDGLRQTLNDLQIKISPQLKSVLDRMIHPQSKKRYQNGTKALQAVEKSFVSRKLLLTLLAAIALIGSGVYLIFVPQPNYARLETSLQNGDWIKAMSKVTNILRQIP